MIEKEIKEMLKDIIDNGAEYVFRWLRTDGWSDWKPYKLGEEILCNDSRYEYRKVEKWCVVKETNQTFTICPYEKAKQYNPIHFEGSKEQCEEWVEEHAKKTWFEKILKEKRKSSTVYTRTELDMYELGCEDGIVEVCKKILKEVRECEGIEQMTKFYIGEIVQNLGVEV